MSTFQKISQVDAAKDAWDYVNGAYVEGDSVQTVNYQYPAQDKSFVIAKVVGEHGWSTAASDYYYIVIDCKGIFETKDEVMQVSAGDSIRVPAGTEYNYRSSDRRHILRVALFMNNLWKD